MQLHLVLNGEGPLQAQLYRELRQAMQDGRLQVGERMPPSRVLARELALSRQLVVVAYERLIAEGFLCARPGSGTFVARLPASEAVAILPAGVSPGPHWVMHPVWGNAPARRFNFAGGVTEREQLPWQAWRRCLNRAVRDQQAETLLYGEVQGDLRLRLGLVEYLGYSRGLPCSADQLLITQGAQQGLDLLARVRLAPGDCVAMEEPGYPPARAVFEAVGAKVIPVPVDEEGLCVDRIPDQAGLVYLTPSHQFPLGMPMSLSRRLALLERARATEMLIVEDDYDGEFRFEGRPLEALKRLDHHQQVAYLGSFSKVLHASFRMGYIVMPGGLQAALLQAKSLTDSSSNDLTQRALGYLIEQGDFARHLKRMQRRYASRREKLLAALRRQSALTVLPQMAGLHIAGRTPPVRDLADALNREGVTAMSLESLYMAEPAMPGVLLGFGALPDDTIEDGVSALTRALAR